MALACFQLREEVRLHSGERRRENVEEAKSMMDIQPKIATLERVYIEFAKGFNESDDANIKGASGGLRIEACGHGWLLRRFQEV